MVSDLRQSLQKLPVEPGGAATMTPLTEGYTGDLDPAWSPDGTRLVFSSSRSGSRNIWTVKADLSKPMALTEGRLDRRAPGIFASTGTQVAFVSDREGRRGIWVVSADGGSPRLVASVNVLTTVSWARDGTRLVYAVGGGEVPQLETVEVTSGKVSRLPTETRPMRRRGRRWRTSSPT